MEGQGDAANPHHQAVIKHFIVTSEVGVDGRSYYDIPKFSPGVINSIEFRGLDTEEILSIPSKFQIFADIASHLTSLTFKNCQLRMGRFIELVSICHSLTSLSISNCPSIYTTSFDILLWKSFLPHFRNRMAQIKSLVLDETKSKALDEINSLLTLICMTKSLESLTILAGDYSQEHIEDVHRIVIDRNPFIVDISMSNRAETMESDTEIDSSSSDSDDDDGDGHDDGVEPITLGPDPSKIVKEYENDYELDEEYDDDLDEKMIDEIDLNDPLMTMQDGEMADEMMQIMKDEFNLIKLALTDEETQIQLSPEDLEESRAIAMSMEQPQEKKQ